MSEKHFSDSIEKEMAFHELARKMLTKEERDSLDQFNEEYDYLTTGKNLSADAEGNLIKGIFKSIQGSEDAFNHFNRIVDDFEKKSTDPSKYRNN